VVFHNFSCGIQQNRIILLNTTNKIVKTILFDATMSRWDGRLKFLSLQQAAGCCEIFVSDLTV
jgi:hypothetical protein